MIVAKIAISNNAPSIKDVIWAKPEQDGFMLYMLAGGKWLPLKMSGSDAKAVKYEEAGAAEKVKNTVIGSKKDSKSVMTLYGLKAYIDDAIAGLE